MRTSNVLACSVAIGLGLALGPAAAFDGKSSPSAEPVVAPAEGPPSAARSLKSGERATALMSLEYAADQGHPAAQWKLGRMYADGDGVPQDNLRAFNYFTQIANSHPDESPGTPQGRMVANAFVALGHYYLNGIPNTRIKANASRAREMFGYAASYFGDAEAQYYVGRLYLDGSGGVAREPRQAARWLQLAATKGQCKAQVLLGDMLFRGDEVPRQAARGLMWLTLGRDCSGADETVKPLYDKAFRHASEDERALALVYLESWLKGRRE